MKYVVTMRVRKQGAIGAFHDQQFHVVGENAKEARDKALEEAHAQGLEPGGTQRIVCDLATVFQAGPHNLSQPTDLD